MNRPSPYKDKTGKVIHDGDYTRKLTVEDFPPHEYWLYEQVRFYNNDWYLFEVGFDYETGNDEPYPLWMFHSELEVIDESMVEREIVN